MDQATVGGFTFDPARQSWEWSTEAATIHGRPPGFTPTTEQVVAHKHPDDRAAFRHLLADVITNGAQLSSRHRIVRTDNQIREVIVVASRANDTTGPRIDGLYVDITDSLEQDRQDAVTAAIAELAEHRATIEQAKGMLMAIYSIPADRAFDVLRWISQTTNTRIRAIAEKLVNAALTLHTAPTEHREAFDRLLLTLGR